MPTLVMPKFQTPVAFTISLAGLVSSTAGVGRQATMIDNTTPRYQDAQVSASIKLGTSPTANTAVYLYLIRSDNAGTPIITDGAGLTDAGLTIKSAQLIGILNTGPSSATGDVLKENFVVPNLGPKWTIAVVNSSGVALDATAGNHVLNYIGLNPEIQA